MTEKREGLLTAYVIAREICRRLGRSHGNALRADSTLATVYGVTVAITWEIAQLGFALEIEIDGLLRARPSIDEAWLCLSLDDFFRRVIEPLGIGIGHERGGVDEQARAAGEAD